MREKLSITSGRVCESQLCESRICHGAQVTVGADDSSDSRCRPPLSCFDRGSVGQPYDLDRQAVSQDGPATARHLIRPLCGLDNYAADTIADSNVLMPADYIQRLFASWQADTGLVASPPIGSRPQGFWAEIECTFLNTYQARWQYVVDSFGNGFAQGKTMLWRREDLERAGGIATLGKEVAEDAAATKIVRAAGLKVRLVDWPFAQPLGRRSASEVWNRQLRWARLRRASFFVYFLPELLSGGIVPMIC